MLRIFLSVFRRYHQRMVHFDWPGPALPSADGGPGGQVDRITRKGPQLIVEGWCPAEVLHFLWPHGGSVTVCDQPRPDVAEVFELRPDCGFAATVPAASGPLVLAAGQGEAAHRISLPSPPMWRRIWADLRVTSRFIRALARSAGDLPKAMAGDPGARGCIKARLGLDDAPMPAPLETRLFDQEGLAPLPVPGPITIVMPVYNAFDLCQEALARVEAHTDLDWHLILIEDASPDARVRPWLRDWAAARPDRVTLLENDRNLGFIGSVNRGFQTAMPLGRHVVLLNSDALVPKDWASRLLRPIVAHRNVASVTPMSNDATILSVPRIAARCDLAPGDGDRLDALARQFNPEALLSVLPTGVGFCMAMNIRYLRKLPRFDVVFGRGYGEEVDWCQRARARGGRHLGLPGLFVEHRGGESFGSAEKARLIARNNRRITARYPRFDAEVQRFLGTDPLATARLALGIALGARSDGGRVPVYLGHMLGGGAEIDLKRRVAADLARGGCALILRVGGLRRWRLELHHPAGVTAGETDDLGFVRRLLDPIAAIDLIYSCGVGDRDPAGLPESLLTLLRPNRADRLHLLFHDFFPLSPSYTLLDSDGRFRGDVPLDTSDRAHRQLRPDGAWVSLAGWRAAWGRLIDRADRLTVFSADSWARVVRVYPKAASKLQVVPHRLPVAVPRLAACGAGQRRVLGVLGNIGPQKGAPVLRDLARRLGPDGRVSLALIGNIDPGFPLPDWVPITGNYTPADIPRLARHHGVTDWLIPSIWPETFSFTTHEALATGLPVFAFHLGAQGQAVHAAANGHPLHFDSAGDLAGIILAGLEAADLDMAARGQAVAEAAAIDTAA